MKKTKFISCLMLLCSSALAQVPSQNIRPGIYTSNNESHKNRNHYEEITLNIDKSFIYKAHLGEFINIKKFGNWKLDNDTLILNEHNPEFNQMMSVVETNDRIHSKNGVYLDVKYFDGDDFLFTVSATFNDTTLILRNNTKHSTIPLKKVQEFSINSTSYNYPKYLVKDSMSNSFTVRISPKRLLVNEKWLVEDGKLRPRTTDGLYAGYYLSIKL